MPRIISTAMREHLNGTSLQLCTCWIITRKDGAVFRLTDNNTDLVFDGATYSSLDTYDRTAVANASDLSADNLDVFAVLNSGDISDTDLREGKFDHAAIEVFMVNHAAPDTYGKMRLKMGSFGEIRPLSNAVGFTTTLLGLMDKLDANIERYIKPECSAELGDAECQLKVAIEEVERDTAYAVGDVVSAPDELDAETTAIQILKNTSFSDMTGALSGPDETDGSYRFSNATDNHPVNWGDYDTLDGTITKGSGLYDFYPYEDGVSPNLPVGTAFYMNDGLGSRVTLAQLADIATSEGEAIDVTEGSSVFALSFYARFANTLETLRVRVRALRSDNTQAGILYDSTALNSEAWGATTGSHYTRLSTGELAIPADSRKVEVVVEITNDSSGTFGVGFATPAGYVVKQNTTSRETTPVSEKLKAVNLIPASGEWVYATYAVTKSEFGVADEIVNENTGAGAVDALVSLDSLEQNIPNIGSVNLTVAWFGDDLRVGSCAIKPGVETVDQINSPASWTAGGTNRSTAHLISQDEEGRPYYGGTPDDNSVVSLIQELTTRGIAVTMSPFLLMDIPPGNGLTDPYGTGAEQPAFPWRGRATCSPAPGEPSTADKTAAARTQVDSFFGTASASDFSVSGESVSYSGPSEWSYRRFVLHLAALAKAAGGVERFLLGSELVALTRLRDGTGAFPATEQLIDLAAEVRILLPSAEIGYAADWTEYGAYTPSDGSNDVVFPLDDLWADAEIDFVGLDWYAPMSDWRDGNHTDLASYTSIYSQAYLKANIEGGEHYDWYYASQADRDAQTRTPISDSAHGEDWLFRSKDIRGWWASSHHARPGGTRSGTPTAWVPESKPVYLIEIGCGAIDKGSNAPNVFYDAKSSESGLPPYSNGNRDDRIQAAVLSALIDYWNPDEGNNPTSSVYSGSMITPEQISVWCWDLRPYPAFPLLTDVWADGENWDTGHWINGRVSYVTTDLLGRAFRCTAAGTTALIPPSYPSFEGDTVIDGTAVFVSEKALRTRGVVTEVQDDSIFHAQIFGETRSEDDSTWFAKGVVQFRSGAMAGIASEVKSCVFDGAYGYTLETFLPFSRDLKVGDEFYISTGCDFSRETCRDKFDNVVNFRGFPDLPGTDAISQYNIGF